LIFQQAQNRPTMTIRTYFWWFIDMGRQEKNLEI